MKPLGSHCNSGDGIVAPHGVKNRRSKDHQDLAKHVIIPPHSSSLHMNRAHMNAPPTHLEVQLGIRCGAIAGELERSVEAEGAERGGR